MAKQHASKNKKCWFAESCDLTTQCFCKRYECLKWQMDNSGLPVAKQKPVKMFIMDENKADEKAYKQLNSIRENIDDFVRKGENLYLCSQNVGNGKTSWAIRMLHTYFALTAENSYEHLRGVFVSVPNLFVDLRDFESNVINAEYRKLLYDVDLVVWDDIAITGMTEYQYLQLYTFINNRVFAEKSNIFTSNVTQLEDLQDIVGQRIASRAYNMSLVVELVGADVR